VELGEDLECQTIYFVNEESGRWFQTYINGGRKTNVGNIRGGKVTGQGPRWGGGGEGKRNRLPARGKNIK